MLKHTQERIQFLETKGDIESLRVELELAETNEFNAKKHGLFQMADRIGEEVEAIRHAIINLLNHENPTNKPDGST